MAKQCGPVYFEKTWDDLVFYKMQGEYYVRVKSSLTAARVKTSAAFVRMMYSANRMARASKIGSAIYQALPPGWRQFWMYRSFTGEANKNHPALQTILQAKAKKVRKRRQWKLESLLRLKGKNGKLKFRDPQQEEEKRQRKEMNDVCYARTMEHLAQQEQQACECLLSQQAAINHQAQTTTAIAVPKLNDQMPVTEPDLLAA